LLLLYEINEYESVKQLEKRQVSTERTKPAMKKNTNRRGDKSHCQDIENPLCAVLQASSLSNSPKTLNDPASLHDDIE